MIVVGSLTVIKSMATKYTAKTQSIAFLVFLMLFLLNKGYSQHATSRIHIKWGELTKCSPYESIQDILGKKDGYFYCLKKHRKSDKTEYYIECLNDKFELLNSKKINDEYNGKKHQIEKVCFIGDNIYVFTSLNDKKIKKRYLYKHKISHQTLSQTDKSVLCGQLIYTSNLKRGNFVFVEPEDNSALLVIYDLYSYDPSRKNIDIQLYGNDGNLYFDKSVNLSYKDNLCEITRAFIENNTVWLLLKVYNNEFGELYNGKLNYQYFLLHAEKSNKKYFIIPISTEDIYLLDIDFAFKDNIVYAIGLQASKDMTSSNAIVFLSYKKTGEFLKQNIIPYTPSMTTGMFPAKRRKKIIKQFNKKNEVRLWDFRLKRFEYVNDSSLIMIAEQQFEKSILSSHLSIDFPRSEKEKQEYSLYNTLVASIDTSGNLIWNRLIMKKQTEQSVNIETTSYYYTRISDMHCFIFNDNPRNLYHSKTGKIYSWGPGSETIASMVSLDNSGNYRRETVFFANRQNIYFLPKITHKISENEILFLGRLRNFQRYGILKIK